MKTLLESKTVWFNVIMLILGSLPIIATFVKAIKPEVAGLIDSVLALITGIGNLILRIYFTEVPISNRPFRR
jgi:hypothetical protein